jgi:radical SAM superfamily enzyme YgiQ (UPF0313 family)
MKKPLKIFLGDLTYNTVSLSTEVFPLNIGYIASHCNERFGNDIEITLFKYIEDLEDAINSDPPAVLGLSNYVWNSRIDLEMFRILKEKNPDAVTVWGGPNFPSDIKSQEIFLKNCPQLDVYVPIDGESGFSNIIERILQISTNSNILKNIRETPIDGCITKNSDGHLSFSNSPNRINNLDEIPSPYLSGLLDKFFDDKLSPMIQTARGCPFSCSFCVDGSDLVNKVNKFSSNRVDSELEYISKKTSDKVHSLHIADLNFGMYPRDLDICDSIVRMQEKYDYPKFINTATGKNQKEKIIKAIKRLNGTMLIAMSVQSMDQNVLKNIRRDNISVDHMLALGPAIKEAGLHTTSEVILGLPGETYESHLNTIQELVRARVEFIQVYTCMLLNGSELNTPEERKKYDFKTKFRILPRDFVKLKNGKKILEIEEVIVGSNVLTFEEYVELRVLAFVLWVTTHGTVYEPILKFLREKNIDVFQLLFNMMKKYDNSSKSIQKLVDQFKQSTINELYDSPDEIENKFQNDKEYEKLLTGEYGINVIQYYHALVTADHMDSWTEFTIEIANELIQNHSNSDQELSEQINDIYNYCRGLCHNPMGDNRLETSPQYVFKYDIKKWLDDEHSSLKEFKFKKSTEIKFKLTKDQFKMVQDQINIRGKTPHGRAMALKRIHVSTIWRRPLVLDSKSLEMDL